tara:strand:- start:3405 stop:5864 length:2460 start_codon:yes stop_codon:yes gene_type:complete
MPRNPKDNADSPKNYKMKDKSKKKKKAQESGSDSDSSSDYQPGDDVEDMNTLEMQKFIQKIFPSKSGKERIKQLEKIDKMMEKKEKKKCKKGKNGKAKSVKKNTKHRKKRRKIKHNEEETIEQSEEETTESEYNPEEDEEYDYDYEDDEEFDEYVDELIGDEGNDMAMMPMMGPGGDNMKFNIIFTVGKPGDMYGEEEDEEEDSEAEYNSNEEDGPEIEEVEEEEDEEDEEDEEEETKKGNKRRSKRIRQLEKKKTKDVTEEEWMEMARVQEKEMRENGTYHTTKFKLKQKVQMKNPGWDELKQGKVVKIHRNKKPRLVKYDIRLTKKYKGKYLYKKVPSKRIKSIEENEEKELLKELKKLIDTKSGKGKEAMEKQFEKLTKAQEKKEKAKQKKREEKEKHKNLMQLRKLMRGEKVMNDYKFFKGLKTDDQKKILDKLRDINKFTSVEKPYKIKLIEADIPVEYKAAALSKINTLEYMDPGSGEYYKIKTYVDNFMRIPFGVHKSLPITIDDGQVKTEAFMAEAKRILDEAVYGLNDAKMQILQLVGQWIANPNSLGNAIAIKGPPGTGKTTLIKEGVSKILGRPFAFLALGGATDSSFLEGHSYTYEGSTWGKIVDILLNSKCMNPVFYFDELDKISKTPKGKEITGILTHLTDTTQNDKYHDKYFADVEFNLNKAMFIFSYNDENLVDPILKDRMYRIKTDGYDKKDKCVIAHKYLIPKIEKNINFEKEKIIIPDETIKYICDNLTENEKGVRNLKRCLEIIYSKLNLYRLMKEGSSLFNKEETLKVEFPFTVTKEVVDKLIKKSKDGNDVLSSMYI